MKVALVHDDLVQWGGAERVLVALSEYFPEAPIFTSLINNDHPMIRKHFGSRDVRVSFLQQIPGWKRIYKALLPLYPVAFEQFDLSEYDLVISQTTRFAKSVITKPGTKHICYCHTPPRFLWHFSGATTPKVLAPYLSFLRLYDRMSSTRVDGWLAGSKNAQERIRQVYKQESKVLYPFVDLERFEGVESFDGGYLLTISRLIEYKRIDLVVQTANKLKIPLKVVGKGLSENYLKSIAGPMVDFVGSVDEGTLTRLIAGCKALVVAAEEDFGLTPLEAQALGKPVVAYRKGGALESVIEGQTGYFFDSQTVESLIDALGKLEQKRYNQSACFEQSQRFSKEIFLQTFQRLISSM